MSIKGFKAFNSDMTNRYGLIFEEKKLYHVDGDPSFGLNGNGFHFCENIEDTFRFFDPNNCTIAEVTGLEKIVEGFDTYNDYYNMYSCSDIYIDHIMSRDEVISKILDLKVENRVCRFIATGYKLNKGEIIAFRSKFKDSILVNQYIDYYVLDDKQVFEKSYKKVKIMK